MVVTIIVVGVFGFFTLEDHFYPEPQMIGQINEAEAYTSIMFSSNILFYDMSDPRNEIHNEQRYNCGGQMDGSSNILECIRIHDKNVLTLSWWQIIDGEFRGMSLPCDERMVCLQYQNTTAFLLIKVEDPTIKIDVTNTLKSNLRITEMKDYKHEDYHGIFKLVTVDLSELNDHDGHILPTITLLFPTNFENKCLFSNDRITCDLQQQILEELRKN